MSGTTYRAVDTTPNDGRSSTIPLSGMLINVIAMPLFFASWVVMEWLLIDLLRYRAQREQSKHSLKHLANIESSLARSTRVILFDCD